MKFASCLRVGVSALALSITGSALSSSLPSAQVQTGVGQRDVIVILRDQLSSTAPMRGAMTARAAAAENSQQPLIAQLQQARSRTVRSFKLINAFATSVSQAEADRLAADPAVRAVVPDLPIRAPHHKIPEIGTTSGGGVRAATAAAPQCNTLEPEALRLTNTAFPDTSIPQAQLVTDGNGQLVTGKGVTVAYIADGLDPTIKGFVRPDGTSVFVDYQNFTGDPAGTPTPGGEAFGDASSIAAQDMPNGKPLIFDISKFVNQAHPLPSPCKIRIRGMAPGASLVGLNVFSSLGYTTNSTFIQAIDYAVSRGVDVINESFGGNPYPDNSTDPITLADAAAVAAGITVVVSTGDAGTAGTLGSPSTSAPVISVGGSTSFRLYQQIDYGAQALANGFISNNISSLSSGGFAQIGARTVDVVAPGDLGWALCSTNTNLYEDCTNYQTPAKPSSVQAFGGTSESAPLTSGLAALVIQAYRSTHGGANPSPALVKRIIMSTATDLSAPAFEQGAGLINSLAAVNAALSIADSKGTPPARGAGFVADVNSLQATALPGAPVSQSFMLTNTGTTTQHLTPVLEALSPPIAGATLDLTLDPSHDPTFPNVTGAPRAYIMQQFTVPANATHLDASIAWQAPYTGTDSPIAYLSLLDPSGRQAAYSIPQGLGSGFGHVDVVWPAAGTWTAVIFTRASGAGSYSGPLQFTWAAEKRTSIGSVTPSQFDLAPGATTMITASLTMPSQPGDMAGAIRFMHIAGQSGITWPDIPVSLRTLVPVTSTGGSFTGTLAGGGNGRPGAGPTQTFEFDVPSGVSNMNLALLAPDNLDLLEGLLVDPNGMELSVQANYDTFGESQYALQLSREYPQAGRWKFILLQDFYSSGDQTSLPFSARIAFNQPSVSAPALPNSASTKLSASAGPVNIPIHLTNMGPDTEVYFADARLRTPAMSQLMPACGAAATLPGGAGCFYIPTQAKSVKFVAQSAAPIMMDAFNDTGFVVGGTGTPDILASQVSAGTMAATLNAPEVPYGLWFEVPSLIGPYSAAGAQKASATLSAFALMQPFDLTASADSGDAWEDLTLGTATYNPLPLGPGQPGVITLTITPDSTKVGQTVSGYLYIDTYNSYVGTGDEVVRLPYSYTISK